MIQLRGAGKFRPLRDELSRAKRLVLTSHLFPDGDSIASEVALALHLRSQGKQVWLAHEAPPTERYQFLFRYLPADCLIRWTDASSLPPVDAVVCLDVSSWDYMGAFGDWLRRSGLRTLAIDHHRASASFGDHALILEDAVSTGEVLYRYLRAVRAAITPSIASALYASVLFDTGGFRSGQSDGNTIQLAAELIRLGADHRDLYTKLFEVDSWPKLDLLRHALGKLESACDGRLAWLSIPEDLLHLTGARFADGDGFLDDLLTLRDLELCAMFREVEDGGVKATFRSKGRHDVGHLAQEFGGGGRTHAAGVFLPGTLHQVMDSVLPRLRRCFLDVKPRRGLDSVETLLDRPASHVLPSRRFDNEPSPESVPLRDFAAKLRRGSANVIAGRRSGNLGEAPRGLAPLFYRRATDDGIPR